MTRTAVRLPTPCPTATDNTTVSGTDQARENALLARDLRCETILKIHREARAHSFIRDAPV